MCRLGARIHVITRQVRNLRCQKKVVIITHVGTNNLQRIGSEKFIDDMKQLCETARAKTDSHIVICLLLKYKDGRQLHYDKILYINRRQKAMSHDKGFNLIDVYWAFNENPNLFKGGLHLSGEGAGILGTSVSIATQVNVYSERL